MVTRNHHTHVQEVGLDQVPYTVDINGKWIAKFVVLELWDCPIAGAPSWSLQAFFKWRRQVVFLCDAKIYEMVLHRRQSASCMRGGGSKVTSSMRPEGVRKYRV